MILVFLEDLNQSIRLLLDYLDDKRDDIKRDTLRGMVYLKKRLMKKKRVIWWM